MMRQHIPSTKQPDFAEFMAKVAQLKSAHGTIIKNQKALQVVELRLQQQDILSKLALMFGKSANTQEKHECKLALMFGKSAKTQEKHDDFDFTELDKLRSSLL